MMAGLGLGYRETTIPDSVIEGKTNAEIVRILSIGPRTVQKPLAKSYSKLGIENRYAAIRMGMDRSRDPS